MATTATPSPSVDPAAEANGSSSRAASPAASKSVPRKGDGTISVVQVPGPASTASGRVVRYTVEIEGVLGVDASKVAQTVHGVLLDPRGWQRRDDLRFLDVSPAQASREAKVDIRIALASPALTDRCACRCAPCRRCPAGTAPGWCSTCGAG